MTYGYDLMVRGDGNGDGDGDGDERNEKDEKDEKVIAKKFQVDKAGKRLLVDRTVDRWTNSFSQASSRWMDADMCVCMLVLNIFCDAMRGGDYDHKVKIRKQQSVAVCKFRVGSKQK